MSTSEPELSPDVANAKGLRPGWTTGTCASAAAKAATIGLVTGTAPETVEVELPSGQLVTFSTADVQPGKPNQAAVIKDAGDDPDCTDGAHITATVDWDHPAQTTSTASGNPDRGNAGSVTLRGGDGVGTVTKPGLGLDVGGPAINPVPRRMITAAITEITDRPVTCTISVPGGQKMAEKTSNTRLGILGGISILGTTGIVKPFSTASYRASVVQQIDVAAAQNQQQVVVCTGSRSDDWAQQHWPDFDTVCFIEVGDFTGIALRRAWSHQIGHLIFVGMAGKIAKLAAGVMMTHFHRSKVDTDLLAAVAVEANSSEALVTAATETNTARHFAEQCLLAGDVEPLRLLCQRAVLNCRSHIGVDTATASDPSVYKPSALDQSMQAPAAFDSSVHNPSEHSPTVNVIMVDFAGKNEICRA